MANERITEDIVRQHFKLDRMFSDIKLEEQMSSESRIQKYLENASKCGNGIGKPEFILSFKMPSLSNLIIVVECKANIIKHESKFRNRHSEYAVDGALLYSSYLSKNFDVISIAVSGDEPGNMKVSSFLQLKNLSYKQLETNELLSLESYIAMYTGSEERKNIQLKRLLDYSKKLNDQLHNKKVKESQRSLLISGILIALESQAFLNSYKHFESPKELSRNLVNTIASQLKKADLQDEKIANLKIAYSFIEVHTSLSEENGVLLHFIDEIKKEILDFIKNNHYYDVLGQFYIEFLRYANSDKGLGIVLTPPHITQLLCDITYVNSESIVFDNCTGTGGFLISAMSKMISDAKGNLTKIQSIKRNQLIGVEYQEDIFALAISNMFIHGDGKSNIFSGDCFEVKVQEKIDEKFKPNVGLLNPPYKTQRNDKEELDFVFNNLDRLQKGSYCAAIIPMSIVLATTGTRFELKKKLLENHTLEAVLSMPDELFLNSHASVITCVIVVKAKERHQSSKETYFGYWKNDGFVRLKYQGRVDLGDWTKIRELWLESYINKKEIPGLSVMQRITASDEWCAEAFMKTDYSLLTYLDFIDYLKRYSTFLFLNELRNNVNDNRILTGINNEINTDIWKSFRLTDLFKIQRGKEKALDTEKGSIPLVMATRENNGVASRIFDGKHLFKENVLTVVGNGASTGETFFQPVKFYAGSDVSILEPRIKIDKYALMFIAVVIKLESYRFSYGRKWTLSRLEKHEILLPSNGNEPSIEYMSQFIKSLPYSENI